MDLRAFFTALFAPAPATPLNRAPVPVPMASSVPEARQIREILRNTISAADARETLLLPPHPYAARMERLLQGATALSAYNLDCKIYLKDEPYVYSYADGSLRISKGLLDLLDDDEVLFLLARELGHILLNHSLAYARDKFQAELPGMQDMANVQEFDQLSLPFMAKSFSPPRYAPEQEQEADAWAIAFLGANGLDLGAVLTAMRKLSPVCAEGSQDALRAEFDERFRRIQKLIFPDASGGDLGQSYK